MRRYEGPIKPEMEFQHAEDSRLIWTRVPPGTVNEELARTYWRPVRPTTPEGWALFLPDGLLPDTGSKVAKVGEIWATTYDGVRLVSRRAVDGPASTVRICALTREWTTHAWLCEEHRAAREAKGWRIFLVDSPAVFLEAAFTGRCDDCPPPRQPKKVAFAPTRAESRVGGAAAQGRAPMTDLWSAPG